MGYSNLQYQRRGRQSVCAFIIFSLLVSLASLHRASSQFPIRGYLPTWTTPKPIARHDDSHQNFLDLLPDYKPKPKENPFCDARFGHQYLEIFRDNAIGYCTPNSLTNLTCFHSLKPGSEQIHSFCFGQAAMLDPADQKFSLDCELRNITNNETSTGVPPIHDLSTYWYNTGPKVVFDQSIKFDSRSDAVVPDKVEKRTSNFTILLKREGAHNLWHSLMEIWAMTMTLDILRISQEPGSGAPFYSRADAENTQVLILDDHDDGPYFDLWTMFAKRPPIRSVDLPATPELENIIVPLPGATNPFWSGDWNIHPCDDSDLFRTFSHRVLEFYDIDNSKAHDGELVLTFIDRMSSRRLLNQTYYLDILQALLPNVKIQVVDFAAFSFREQLEIVRDTDILVGVHGAGLTHGMFLKEGSVMVEILPKTLTHKGFRNIAGIAGHGYFSTHASNNDAEEDEKVDWHVGDVFLEEERFLGLIEVAVKSVYNKGLRNFDVNKR